MRETIVKTPRLRTAFVSVLALALCSIIVIETLEISRLSKQISALKEENSRLSRAGNLAPVQDETRLSIKERQELMRLRGEVGLLRNQITEMVAPEPKPDDAPQAVEAPPVVLSNDSFSVVHKTNAQMNKGLVEYAAGRASLADILTLKRLRLEQVTGLDEYNGLSARRDLILAELEFSRELLDYATAKGDEELSALSNLNDEIVQFEAELSNSAP